MLECVVNVSEGRDRALLAALAEACGQDLLDLHRDADHHRAVLTTVGEDAPRRLTRLAVRLLDLTLHRGVHPRLGVVDVVPFVPIGGSSLSEAVEARDRFGTWAATELGVPGFAYGPERSLPDVRRHAFTTLPPTWGPSSPHPTAGAICVGARPVLVAYNVWLAGNDLAEAKRVATAVRRPGLRALGLPVGGRVQVSMNLVTPDALGPADAYDAVAEHARVAGAELVGLLPARVLAAVPPHRWEALDLDESRTIEARLARLRP